MANRKREGFQRPRVSKRVENKLNSASKNSAKIAQGAVSSVKKSQPMQTNNFKSKLIEFKELATKHAKLIGGLLILILLAIIAYKQIKKSKSKSKTKKR